VRLIDSPATSFLEKGHHGHSPMTEPAGGPIAPSEETPVWTGSPSQWINFGWFAACVIGTLGFVAASVVLAQPIVAAGAAIPVLVAITKVLTVRTTRIDVTTERITTTVGIFSRRKWDLELYRVKDTTLSEPFLLRLVGRANIEIVSSDRTSPILSLRALPNAEWLRQQIRAHVERLRLKRGVREMDMDIEH
jgi:membrane protein YdbS with pleckstrin-like domain